MLFHLPDPAKLRQRFDAARPTRHFVIDAFLPPRVFARAASVFPPPQAPIWHRYRSGKEHRKLQSRDLGQVPHALARVLRGANRRWFIAWLGRATGIDGLLGDPAYDGGGLHQTLRGGRLGIHVDYNYHGLERTHRRLNAILFLNETWEAAWGGELELWDDPMRVAAQIIPPIGNRLVVFETNERSWHGHPSPLATPPGITRKSIATYYYTRDRPTPEIAPYHGTIFRERPGERFRPTLRERASAIKRLIVPR